MGAVRIYKGRGLGYGKWQARSGGCSVEQPFECNWGRVHGGFCKSFDSFSNAIISLNNPNSQLGAYLKK